MKKLHFILTSVVVVAFLSTLTFGQDFARKNLDQKVKAPDRDGAVVLQWDDGVNFDAIGLTSGGTFEVSARFPASITGTYSGYNLTQVEIYINDVPDNCTLKIYDQGTATSPGTLLHSEDVTSATVSGWNIFTLSSPVAITGDDIWVGYEVTHAAGFFPAGVDAGPAVPDGDWIYLSPGPWAHLNDFGLPYNWNIHAYLESGGGGSVFFDDFEAYTAGQQLACQNPVDWTTWSIAPCDPVEDAYVSDMYSYSGNNSTVIVQNNDLVKPLGSLTSGKWYISFVVYIPAGKSGYFNTLSGFTPNPFEWAMECYFDAGGAGRLFGGAATPIAFTWLEDTWQQVMIVVDLDTDMAEFWFGTGPTLNMIHSWQWTLGASGGGSALQLDANDFFGATADDEMYFDDYYFGDTPPPIVPVELTSFTAVSTNEGYVELNWVTASELNNHRFEIERRAQDGQYRMIGYVDGKGTTTEEQFYSYTDRTVTPGVYYYRLKQVDFSGTYEYSDEVQVEVNPPLVFGLEQNYPNPFNPSTTIKFSLPSNELTKLTVYNALGEEVALLINEVLQAGFHQVSFNAAGLPSGVYFYRIEAGDFTQVRKMMLTK
ncbi:MAG: hypothetical protein Kow0098_08580 [Ignavibacteriaceae bacterium]